MSQPAPFDPSQSRPMSLSEWLALPEDEAGEIVDGSLVEEEMPDAVHELLLTELVAIFRDWLKPQRGIVLGSEVKLVIGARGRKADICVFLPGGSVPPRRGAIRVPPDIAVEIVSPTPRDGRRDRVEKFNEYAAFGVRYYWIVDPELRSVEIFELSPARRYARVVGQTNGVVDSVPGCVGFKLDIDALWAALDVLGPESEDPTS